METLLNLHSQPISPDFTRIRSPQYAVRLSLLELGFEYADQAFVFFDESIGKWFFIHEKFLHGFSDAFDILSSLEREPDTTPEARTLCQLIHLRLKPLERLWIRSMFSVVSGGAENDLPSKPA